MKGKEYRRKKEEREKDESQSRPIGGLKNGQ